MAKSQKPPVLIVEDDEIWYTTLETALSKEYKTTVVTSGEDAVEQMEALNPEFIVLDYHLDGEMTGLDTLKVIKQKLKEPKVIMFSAQDDVQVAVDILDKGAYDYVVKGDNAVNRLKIIIRNLKREKELINDNIQLNLRMKRERFWLIMVIVGIFILSMIIYLQTCPYSRPFGWDPFDIKSKEGCFDPSKINPAGNESLE